MRGEKNTGGFYDPSWEPTLQHKRVWQAYDDTYGIVGTPSFFAARRELEIQYSRGELFKLLVGEKNLNIYGYAYFDSIDVEKKVCLAYIDSRKNKLFRLGDEVQVSDLDYVGCVDGIQYNQDEDIIHCIIGFKEEDIVMKVPPSAISKNCTLELGNRD